MCNSPFIFGTTVSKKSFADRKDISTRLQSNLISGINTSIISPRRWGKSSLVEKVIDNIQKTEKQHKTVIIDLFTISSEEEFYEIYTREVIKASSNKWQDWVKTLKKYFIHLVPKISLGIDPNTDFSVKFNWEQLLLHKDEILNLPEEIAKRKNIKFIIALDEFQNLAMFRNYEVIERKLRSIWQRHNNVTYCLYGSKRHMMTDIFNKPSKPFYRFGDIIMLQKIETEEWVKFIVKSFNKTKKKISRPYARLIAQLMKNHSWYVQQLSHYVWQKTELQVSVAEIKTALEELINANSPFYQEQIENKSATQLSLLKAIAKGEKQLTSTAVMNKYRLGTPRNVSKNVQTLGNNDIINKEKGKYELLDPAFEKWFLYQFYNQSYLDF